MANTYIALNKQAQSSKPYNMLNIIIPIKCGSDSEESACHAGGPGSIMGLGRSPGEGYGNPTQIFLPEEFQGQKSGGLYPVYGVTKSQTRLSDLKPDC